MQNLTYVNSSAVAGAVPPAGGPPGYYPGSGGPQYPAPDPNYNYYNQGAPGYGPQYPPTTYTGSGQGYNPTNPYYSVSIVRRPLPLGWDFAFAFAFVFVFYASMSGRVLTRPSSTRFDAAAGRRGRLPPARRASAGAVRTAYRAASSCERRLRVARRPPAGRSAAVPASPGSSADGPEALSAGVCDAYSDVDSDVYDRTTRCCDGFLAVSISFLSTTDFCVRIKPCM